MWITAVLLVVVLLLVVLRRVYVDLFAGSSPNPFAEDVKRPPKPLVTDKEARKKVLKQGQLEGLWVSGLLSGLLLMQGMGLLSPQLVKFWENLLAHRGSTF